MIRYDKLFVIGYNKTATSTFQSLFQENGLSTQHASKWDIENYICFTDNGNNNNFKRLDKDYPNSLFILNVRSLYKWLISRFKHGLRGARPNWAYPYTLEKCAKWAEQRENHHLELLEHFTYKPEKLIIVNIENANWQEYVSEFLSIDIKSVKSRNVNKNTDHDEDHNNILNLLENFFNQTNFSKDHLLIKDKDLLKQYLKLYKNNM